MRKLYAAKPLDEVKLREDAQAFVGELAGQLPTTRYLCELTARHGVELATMVLYQAILTSPEYRPFIDTVDREPAEALTMCATTKVLILPALMYERHPEVGGDGQIVAAVARACGLQARVIPTSSMQSISQNAALLKSELQQALQDGARSIIVVSLSKGAAEFRCYLQRHADDAAGARITHWINISSLANGCHLVDVMLGNTTRRLKIRALATVARTSYQGLLELTTDHVMWQNEFHCPRHIQIINVLPLPLLCHVEKALISRYRRLQALGPNDGMVLSRESLLLPGHIYPVWGCDHFFRSFQISPLLYKLFRITSRQQTHREASLCLNCQ